MKKLIESVTYESPKAEVLLVTSEGVLCESGVFESDVDHDGFDFGGKIS